MKHAYLIMAHNDFELLEVLIKTLDYKQNDIYLHVDKKVKNFDYDKFSNLVQNANIYFSKRIDVKWGSYKQIECTIMLLKMAIQKKHSYYHFISGVDLPLLPADKIYNYFEQSGKNFVAFDDYNNISDFYIERVKYYHIFQNYWRYKNELISKIAKYLRRKFVIFQKYIGINRTKKLNYQFRKGANWFSITEECAKYILNNKKILKLFKHSYCGDELFIQTIIYNSKFKNTLYIDKNGKPTNSRYVDWIKGNPATLEMEDYKSIVDSNMIFARKFSTKKDKNIINEIYEKCKK